MKWKRLGNRHGPSRDWRDWLTQRRRAQSLGRSLTSLTAAKRGGALLRCGSLPRHGVGAAGLLLRIGGGAHIAWAEADIDQRQQRRRREDDAQADRRADARRQTFGLDM